MSRTIAALGILLPASVALGQWGPDFRITHNDSASEIPAYVGRCVVADSEYVHVVWLDDEGPGRYPQTWYIRSTDRGQSWEEPAVICTDTAGNYSASIAALDGYAHIFWSDARDGDGTEVYYTRSTDDGETWSANRRMTTATGTSGEPNAALEGKYVHLVWTDRRDTTNQVYYKRSPDRGFSWTQDLVITALDSGVSHAAVAVADSVVQVVYTGIHGDGPELHYVRSLDNGLNWESDVKLTSSSAPSGHMNPHIAVAGPIVHVVYTDRRSGNDEASYIRSPDHGLSWGPETSLFSTPGDNVGRTVVAGSGTNAHAAAHLRVNSRNWIHYRHSTDAGLTWTQAELLSDSGWSYHASIAVGGTAVHLVWQDGRDGNAEVYYKRNPTANSGVAEEETRPGSVTADYLVPSVVRGVLYIEAVRTGVGTRTRLLDAEGRQVAELHFGANDVGHLSPGVYFVLGAGPRVQGSEGSARGPAGCASSARKVVIQR
ncbi:MAG: exo-alpha-sialidase [candidate division WOR-3 bacterium]|nr:MAG: exo-alpha-sialidase [candidate division WOR-3 bacterium]